MKLKAFIKKNGFNELSSQPQGETTLMVKEVINSKDKKELTEYLNFCNEYSLNLIESFLKEIIKS